MNAEYVMYHAEIWELMLAIRGYRVRQYELFSKLQNIATLQLLTMPFSKKKKINPDDCMNLKYLRDMINDTDDIDDYAETPKGQSFDEIREHMQKVYNAKIKREEMKNNIEDVSV